MNERKARKNENVVDQKRKESNKTATKTIREIRKKRVRQDKRKEKKIQKIRMTI